MSEASGRRVAPAGSGNPLDVYIRVSRLGPRDPERVRSFDDQINVVKRAATERGFTIGNVFDDGFRSGGNTDGREDYAAMIDRLEAGVSGGIAVLNQARLWRNAPRMMDLLEAVVSRGGRYVAIEDGIDTRQGDMTLLSGIKALIDQDYRRQRVQSAFRSDEDLIGQGCYLGSFVPPGFVKPPDLMLVHHAQFAPIMAEAFAMRARGVSLWPIAEFLHENGVRGGRNPDRVKHWTAGQLQTILRNRTYLGEVRKGAFVKTKAHDPIVDLATFEAANHARGIRRNKRRQGNDDPVLLRGPRSVLVRCQGCGYAMKPDAYTNGAGTETAAKVRFYRCRKRHDTGRCAEPAAIQARNLEQHVSELVLARLGTEHAAARARHTDVADLERAVNSAEAELDVFVRVTKATVLGEDRYAEEFRNRERAVLDARATLAEAARPKVVGLPSAMTLEQAWPTLSIDERRKIILATVDHVVVKQATVRNGSRNGVELASDRVVVVWAGQGKRGVSRPGFSAPLEPYFRIWPIGAGEPLQIGEARVEDIRERPPCREPNATRGTA